MNTGKRSTPADDTKAQRMGSGDGHAKNMHDRRSPASGHSPAASGGGKCTVPMMHPDITAGRLDSATYVPGSFPAGVSPWDLSVLQNLQNMHNLGLVPPLFPPPFFHPGAIPPLLGPPFPFLSTAGGECDISGPGWSAHGGSRNTSSLGSSSSDGDLGSAASKEVVKSSHLSRYSPDQIVKQRVTHSPALVSKARETATPTAVPDTIDVPLALVVNRRETISRGSSNAAESGICTSSTMHGVSSREPSRTPSLDGDNLPPSESAAVHEINSDLCVSASTVMSCEPANLTASDSMSAAIDDSRTVSMPVARSSNSIALPPRKRLTRNPEEIDSASVEPGTDASDSGVANSPSTAMNFRTVWKKFSAKSTVNASPFQRSFGGKPMDCSTYFRLKAEASKAAAANKAFMANKGKYFHRGGKTSPRNAESGSPRVTRSQSRPKKPSPKNSPAEPPAPVRKSTRKKAANTKYEEYESSNGKNKRVKGAGNGDGSSSTGKDSVAETTEDDTSAESKAAGNQKQGRARCKGQKVKDLATEANDNATDGGMEILADGTSSMNCSAVDAAKDLESKLTGIIDVNLDTTSSLASVPPDSVVGNADDDSSSLAAALPPKFRRIKGKIGSTSSLEAANDVALTPVEKNSSAFEEKAHVPEVESNLQEVPRTSISEEAKTPKVVWLSSAEIVKTTDQAVADTSTSESARGHYPVGGRKGLLYRKMAESAVPGDGDDVFRAVLVKNATQRCSTPNAVQADEVQAVPQDGRKSVDSVSKSASVDRESVRTTSTPPPQVALVSGQLRAVTSDPSPTLSVEIPSESTRKADCSSLEKSDVDVNNCVASVESKVSATDVPSRSSTPGIKKMRIILDHILTTRVNKTPEIAGLNETGKNVDALHGMDVCEKNENEVSSVQHVAVKRPQSRASTPSETVSKKSRIDSEKPQSESSSKQQHKTKEKKKTREKDHSQVDKEDKPLPISDSQITKPLGKLVVAIKTRDIVTTNQHKKSSKVQDKLNSRSKTKQSIQDSAKSSHENKLTKLSDETGPPVLEKSEESCTVSHITDARFSVGVDDSSPPPQLERLSAGDDSYDPYAFDAHVHQPPKQSSTKRKSIPKTTSQVPNCRDSPLTVPPSSHPCLPNRTVHVTLVSLPKSSDMDKSLRGSDQMAKCDSVSPDVVEAVSEQLVCASKLSDSNDVDSRCPTDVGGSDVSSAKTLLERCKSFSVVIEKMSERNNSSHTTKECASLKKAKKKRERHRDIQIKTCKAANESGVSETEPVVEDSRLIENLSEAIQELPQAKSTSNRRSHLEDQENISVADSELSELSVTEIVRECENGTRVRLSIGRKKRGRRKADIVPVQADEESVISKGAPSSPSTICSASLDAWNNIDALSTASNEEKRKASVVGSKVVEDVDNCLIVPSSQVRESRAKRKEEDDRQSTSSPVSFNGSTTSPFLEAVTSSGRRLRFRISKNFERSAETCSNDSKSSDVLASPYDFSEDMSAKNKRTNLCPPSNASDDDVNSRVEPTTPASDRRRMPVEGARSRFLQLHKPAQDSSIADHVKCKLVKVGRRQWMSVGGEDADDSSQERPPQVDEEPPEYVPMVAQRILQSESCRIEAEKKHRKKSAATKDEKQKKTGRRRPGRPKKLPVSEICESALQPVAEISEGSPIRETVMPKKCTRRPEFVSSLPLFGETNCLSMHDEFQFDQDSWRTLAAEIEEKCDSRLDFISVPTACDWDIPEDYSDTDVVCTTLLSPKSTFYVPSEIERLMERLALSDTPRRPSLLKVSPVRTAAAKVRDHFFVPNFTSSMTFASLSHASDYSFEVDRLLCQPSLRHHEDRLLLSASDVDDECVILPVVPTTAVSDLGRISSPTSLVDQRCFYDDSDWLSMSLHDSLLQSYIDLTV